MQSSPIANSFLIVFTYNIEIKTIYSFNIEIKTIYVWKNFFASTSMISLDVPTLSSKNDDGLQVNVFWGDIFQCSGT